MDWFSVLKNFNLVVEKNSFSKAAKQNYASSSSLSKQVSWLESRLKTTLLSRSTRKLSLTDQGVRFYNESKVIVQQFEELIENTRQSGQAIEGTLSISAPRTFGEVVLVKCIPQFMQKYPKIALKLSLTNHYQDLVEEQIDVAIRTQEITDKTLVSEVFGKKRRGIFASPEYIRASSKIHQPMDLIDHQCLAHADFKPAHLWRFKSESIHISPILTVNNIGVLKELALAGKGIIYLSEYVVLQHIKDKTLIPILKEYWQEPIIHSLVYPRRAFVSRKIDAFVDFMKTINF